jgi:hypothetical protein
MQRTNTRLETVGLTESTDRAAIDAFRSDTGATYPILYGLSTETKAGYGVEKAPSLRVVDGQGRVVGDDEDDLKTALR